MAHSEGFRGIGIMAKFGNAFENRGGTLDMLNRVAEKPEMMRRIVQIIDSSVGRLLQQLALHTTKSVTTKYVSERGFSSDNRSGIIFSDVDENFARRFLSLEPRTYTDIICVVWELQMTSRDKPIAEYLENPEFPFKPYTTIDHLWSMLLKQPAGKRSDTGLVTYGQKYNVFYMLDQDDRPWTIKVRWMSRAKYRDEGWSIKAEYYDPMEPHREGVVIVSAQ